MLPRLPILAALLLAAPLHAAVPVPPQGNPEDPGPHPVGWTDVSLSHPLSGNPVVDARLYYPAASAGQGAAPDASAGPFPLVGFLHGYFAFVDYYDDVCSHLASHGFFVASVATESGLFMSIPNEAKDARAMLTWVESQALSGGPYDGMVAQGSDWSTIGHSNGGAASFHLAAAEPRIARLVLFEPNWLSPPGVATFGGPVMVVGATDDLVAPAAFNAAVYFQNLQASPRVSYVKIVGSGHNGSLDFPIDPASLSHAKAQAMHRRLGSAFLRAEVKGEVELYELLVGAAAELSPLDPTTRHDDPVLWAASSGGQAALGLSGRDDDASALFAVSALPAAVPTPFGQLGLQLTGAWLTVLPMEPDGTVDLAPPPVPGLAGLSVVAQGLRLAPDGTGALTAAVPLVL